MKKIWYSIFLLMFSLTLPVFADDTTEEATRTRKENHGYEQSGKVNKGQQGDLMRERTRLRKEEKDELKKERKRMRKQNKTMRKEMKQSQKNK